jgi:hypothetical protein
MLIRLTPEQVTAYWEAIKEGLEEALPLERMHSNSINNILESVLIGIMQVWISLRRDTKEVVGIVLTTTAEDKVSKTKSLLIYSAHSFVQTIPEDWKEGFMALSKFAKAFKCHNIIAYTSNEDIRKIASHFDAKEEILLTFNLH